MQPKIDQNKISAMREGGHRLGQVREQLVSFTKIGMSFAEIEAEAQRLIKSVGAVPSFSRVPNYHWATCIMKNDEVCHGIPTAEKIVNDGDLITIDVGLVYQDYNLDTTASFLMGKAQQNAELVEFLAVGQKALQKAIAEAKPGHSVYDISFAMQKTAERKGYGMVYQLTGHGIGKELHESPYIPCIALRHDKKKLLYPGQTIAIEIMYTMGKPDLKTDKDGWTFRTIDGSIAGMIEETVLVGEHGPEILTAAQTNS
jgi:methionyl aminopeptidase